MHTRTVLISFISYSLSSLKQNNYETDMIFENNTYRIKVMATSYRIKTFDSAVYNISRHAMVEGIR